MFTTVVAVFCLVTMPSVCVDEIVSDSTMDANLTMMGCMSHWPIAVADWKNNHPTYRNERWVVERIKCVPGRYEIKGRA